jgi:coenzyme F420-0:L-glutamate ligase/coenzyme F420-1:gamma-L-glutamate ligase
LSARLSLFAIDSIPEVRPGDSVARLIVDAARRTDAALAPGDVVVVAQKIVSKAEGRIVELASVTPSPRAIETAAACRKDPRLVELVLRESTDIVRCVPDVLIVRHRLGFVVANAGIDQSNLEGADGRALLLPEDPDRSAETIRREVAAAIGYAPAVIINDSFGRPWRMGIAGTAIGCAGIAALVDMRGSTDRFGRVLQVTQIAAADELAAAASLLMGQGSEGRPVVVVRGVSAALLAAPSPATTLVRPSTQDLFR